MDGIRFVMVKTVCPALVLFFVVSFSVCNFGCRNSIEEIEVLEGDFSVPQIENFAVTGASTLEIGFSKKTVVQNLAVVSKTTESEFCDMSAEYDEETQKTVVALGTQTEVGEDYLIEGQVEDLHGNSLTFSIGFKGFNENPARVILSEVRNAYGTTSVKDEDWISDEVKKIILYHHERLDGSGFPLKLKEAKIPFSCQIVMVCDAFDEMICGIAQRRSKVYEAVEYLKSFKNVKYNGKIVDAFLSFTAVYPAGSHVLTSDGEEAIVVSQNKDFQDRPVIRIIRDKNGQKLKEEKILDLVKVLNVYIEKGLE